MTLGALGRIGALLLAGAAVLGPARVAAAAGPPPTTAVVAPAQGGPILEGDDLTAPGSAKLGLDVLLNDRSGSAKLDPSTLAVVTQPSHGSVTVEGDHTLTYQPAKGYEGVDTFDYQVCDTDGACARASVFVTHDTSRPYVTAGYLIAGAVIGGYAFRTLRRGRKLSPLVPAERRRWM
jgi:hypothetical protein